MEMALSRMSQESGSEWQRMVRWCLLRRLRSNGLLDLIVTRYLDWDFARNVYCGAHRPGYRSYCHPDQFGAISCLVYHNNGDGTFKDVSKACGIASSPGKALGIAINDFDRDGWPDILVANDSFPQQLFKNNHDGTSRKWRSNPASPSIQDGKNFRGHGSGLRRL